MNFEEDDWFNYNDANRPDASPGAGNFYEPDNIANIPLNDDPLNDDPGQELEFNIAGGSIEDYPYDIRESPGGLNGHHHPGTSGSNDVGGQFQNMHIMQNTDAFDPHMQQSGSVPYNSFEMPTVISGNPEGQYQDFGIDDPQSYYASQQPSTSQGNDIIINDSYEMMGSSTSYMPQMDHMNPSSAGNPPSYSGMSQQQDMSSSSQVQQQPPKPKPKKKAPSKKKPTPAPASDTVGSILTKANKMTQQQNNENSNNETTKVETRMSNEDNMVLTQLMMELSRLREEEAKGHDRQSEIADVAGKVALIFSKSIQSNDTSQSGNKSIILNEINSMTCSNGPSTSTQQPQQQLPPPPRRAPPKKKTNNQNSRNSQQQQQQQPMSHSEVQMTPAKVIMDPPTATMVPSNSQMTNVYNDNGPENYVYQTMDEPGTSQQQYSDYHQPESNDSMQPQHQMQGHQQVIQTKLVPTISQRASSSYQQPIANPLNSNGPGPSPLLHQPQSHESLHEQMQDQQYHAQDHQRPQSQQMYVPAHHQSDGQIYQQQDIEPTLGEVLRQTHGRYQGPQDAPHLRQQLISNVNATTSNKMVQISQEPNPSPGNYQNNNIQHQQYGEPFQHHGSYSDSQDMQPHSHSQQGYENQYETTDEYYKGPIPDQDPQMIQSHSGLQPQNYVPEEVYVPVESQEAIMEPEIEYPQVPVCPIPQSKEVLEEKLEEARVIREERVNNFMMEQLDRLNAPLDLTPFKGKMDILERLLPYHHFSTSEEPVSNFESTFQRAMMNAISHADLLGNRVRNIVLRDTMRTSTEWEENMILFLETESERRKLEEDRKLAEQDPHTFLENSDIIKNVQNNRLNLEWSKQAAPSIPSHLKDLNLRGDELTAHYKEYEFDSYDENRPRGSPLPFVYEEPESESEPEPEPEPEKEQHHDFRSDLSPIVGFPQVSPVPSPTRYRNESESTFDWKDEDESPLMSPETVKINKANEQIANELFGTQEELDKPVMFPFEQISQAARKHQQELLQQPHVSVSSDSSSSSSSTGNSPQRTQLHPRITSPESLASSAPRDVFSRGILNHSYDSASGHGSIRNHNIDQDRDEGSPEIDDDYSMSPPESPVSTAEVPQISLPHPVHMIKKEIDDHISKLKLRVPAATIEKGKKPATSDDEDEVQEVLPQTRKPLRLKLNLKDVKREEPSPDHDTSKKSLMSRIATPAAMLSRAETSVMSTSNAKSLEKTSLKIQSTPSTSMKNVSETTPVFKTPLHAPIKTTPADSRKRRSEKIDDTPHEKRKLEVPTSSSFVTPKNSITREEEGAEIGRFLRTMTDGRKIVMKIGKIPRNINHFVTPRRDSKGNIHKNLTATEDTRLKMKFFKRNGELAVEVTERVPDDIDSEAIKVSSTSNGPSSSNSIAHSVKGRPAPASRKPSIDLAGKDKKPNSNRSKMAFSNRFNIFATAPSSKPSTSSLAPPSAPAPAAVRTTVPTNGRIPTTSTRAPSLPVHMSAPVGIQNRVPKTIATASMNLIKTTPIVPKITVTSVAVAAGNLVKPEQPVEVNSKTSSMLPWMFDKAESSEQTPKTTKIQPVSAFVSSAYPSTSRDLLQVKTEPSEAVMVPSQQESPRASSSLSMSFFEDDRGFSFLRSPNRTNEPLPVVEFSDDEEDEQVHKTFSHATDHLLGTSNMNNVNGAAPILPWTTDP
ncbi:hypothetical protein GCK72_014145 [Caenorhabditis remanei]|uniref:GLTSCR protein conserved domain-containing protein n=1 Tax=Caenorhabditis remanei TaxID=31234 RepID=A0A6A5GT82_CAERE|nr:hypothetical protein GCK72_014145 [Caenorhabditis remanei]KAF1757689.1 hypothetical protein GCK72_014145 [Caenorhabditis remanei]